MLDARTRSVVKPGIEVVAQLESVMLVMKAEAEEKVETLVVLMVMAEVKALVMDDDFSDGVDGAGEMLAWYIASYCPLCSLLHYLITLQCTALQCVYFSFVTLPYYITTMLLHYLVVHCSCSTLYYITVYYVILYCIVTLYFVTLLHYLIALQCTALQCVGSYYNGCSLLHYLVTL